MKSILCITGSKEPMPDFSFLSKYGYVVSHLGDTSSDLNDNLEPGKHDIVIMACETRGTQHARIWGNERALFRYVRAGGRMLFCAPGIDAWVMLWNAHAALLPVTPFLSSSLAENFAEHFHWNREKEERRSYRVVPTKHPVCDGIRDWPEFYEGGKSGSYNSFDFDRWLPKPHTDVALRTEDGNVALAFMAVGEGRTGFLLADLHDDAGQAWEHWSYREEFWASLLKHLEAGKLLTQRAPDGVEPFAPRVPLVPRERFAFRPSPHAGNAKWATILTRSDWTMLSDNQVAVNVSPTPINREPSAYGDGWSRDPRSELGIGHVKFYPTVTQFDSALSVDVVVDGSVIEMQPVPGGYQWQPHLVSNRFQSADGGVFIEKRMAVAEDVVCVELTLVRGRVDHVRLRGFNRYHGFLKAEGNTLLGQVESGVIFGLTAVEAVDWTTRENPLRYEGKAKLEGTLTLAFTVAAEPEIVSERLATVVANRDRVFSRAFENWDSYFREQVPAFRSDDPEIERMVYGAFLGFRINLYDIPYEPWIDPHSCPSKMHFDCQWEQDDVQSTAIGKWLRDPSLIERQLLRPFRLGFVLNANATYGSAENATRGVIGELHQYSIPLREVYLFDPRQELRDAIITALLRNENENKEWSSLDPKTGLYCTYDCLGMDDSPRWDLVSPGQKAEWFQTFVRPILTPDVNATMAHRAAFLGELLAANGDARATEYIKSSVDRKALVRQHLWSETVGFFVDRIADERSFSDVITPMGFTPLLLGSFDEEVMARISKTLYNPAIFATPYGLPTVAGSDPNFDPLSYWRGSIWSRTNWFACEGLYAGGLKADAAELTRRWIGLVLKDGADLRENFNPVTGNKKCATMFTEGLAGVVDVYLKNVVGFRPTWKGFDLDPIALDGETPSFSFGPFRYREREIVIWWDRDQGRGGLRVDEQEEVWEHGVCRSFDLSPLSAEIA